MDGGAWEVAVHGIAKSQTRLSDFTFTFHLHALEKEVATHSSVLAWRIPGTGEPGGLPSMGSRRVGHDWSGLAAAAVLYCACVVYICIYIPHLLYPLIYWWNRLLLILATVTNAATKIVWICLFRLMYLFSWCWNCDPSFLLYEVASPCLVLYVCGFPGSSDGKESACSAGDLVQSLGQEDLLEKGMATHSSILDWRIPWTKEPDGLQSMGLQTVEDDWVTFTFHTGVYWQLKGACGTLVLWPGIKSVPPAVEALS